MSQVFLVFIFIDNGDNNTNCKNVLALILALAIEFFLADYAKKNKLGFIS